ncbi:MAG: lamin tail domain-containing protein [Verrucomicrobiales bacterium]
MINLIEGRVATLPAVAPFDGRLGGWWAVVAGMVATTGAAAIPAPPVLTPPGGAVRSPARVAVSQPDPLGAVFYTMDGSDPRTVFGEVAPGAHAAARAISINRPTVLRTRVRAGADWSPLVTAAYTVDQDFSNLLISELMYHPKGSNDDAEFMEFVNVGRDALDVGGLFLRMGGDEAWMGEYFHFPLNTRVGPGAFLVLVRRPDVYRALHPDGPVHGITALRFDNSSAPLRLESAERAWAAEAFYDSAAPWQVAPDNHGYFPDDDVGFSLVRDDLDPARDPRHHSGWRASAQRYGSPGRHDPPSTVPPVFINELMTRGSSGVADFVEFYNPNDHAVDLGGWWLSDERNFPFRYNLPAGTTVPARGYLVLDEAQFGAGVGFSGEGERCYIFSADSAGTLTGFSHGFHFSGADRGASFGRHVATDGSESFPVQAVPTPGALNAGPALPPVVITKIGYRDGQAHSPFIELFNRTVTDMPLNTPDDPEATWALGAHPHAPSPLPPGLVIRARQSLVLVRDDAERFRQTFLVPAEVPVIAVAGIHLSLRPDNPILLFAPAGRAGDSIRRMTVEQVDWKTNHPWPPGANAVGYSLQRINPNRFANDPANWRAVSGRGALGTPDIGNQPPRVWAGGPRLCFTGREATLNGEVADDAWDGMAATVVWSQSEGPAIAVLSHPTTPTTRVQFPEPGTYQLKLRATDSQSSVEDTAVIEVRDGGFETWARSHFPDPEADRHPLSDPDRDGATNLEEYIFDTPPGHALGTNPIELRVVAGQWEIAWAQRSSAEDFEVTVESASDLDGPWLTDPAYYEFSESLEEQLTRVVVRERYPVSGRDRAYVRLRVGLR